MSERFGTFRRSGKALPRILALAAVLTAVGLALAFTRSGGGDQSKDDDFSGLPHSPEWYQVEKRTFDLTVTSSGELEAKRKVEIKNQVEGTTTIIELVDEGKRVNEGDVLVRLSDDEIKERVVQEQLAYEQARADKIAAEQNLAIEKNDADNEVKASELAVELARLDLKKWEQGTDPQQRRDLKLDLDRAERKLTRAKEDVRLSEQLFTEEFISEAEKDDDVLEVIEAEAALDSAKLKIEVYEQYTRPKEMKKSSSDLEQAIAALDRVKRKNQSKLAQAEANMRGKDQTLHLREDRLAKNKEQLVKTVVIAPQDGLVVYASSVGSSRRRGDPISQGRQVRFNETLIMLPDTREMVAKLKVHEAMVAQVKQGQHTTVTIDARPTEPLDGEVISIGVMAEDGGWLNPNLREYEVTVGLPAQEDTGSLKPAMRCSGRIIIGTVKDSLAIPLQAVHTEGRQRFCYLRVGRSRVRRQEVKVGRSGEIYAEIRSGLSESDQILLRAPKPGELVEPKRTESKPEGSET